MKKQTVKYILFRILRATAVYFITLLLFIMAVFAFNSALGFETFRDFELNERVMAAIITVLLFLSFSTVINVMHRNDSVEREKFYTEANAPRGFLNNLAGVLKGADFYIETACIILWIVIFPVELNCKPIINSKYLSVLLAFSIIILIKLITRISVRNHWAKIRRIIENNKNKKENEFATLLKQYAMVFAAYYAGLFMLAVLLPATSVYVLLIAAHPWTVIFLIAGIILAISIIRIIRAITKRAKFLRQLKECCKSNRYELSKIKYPYISLFKKIEGYNFSIYANKKLYYCKLVAGNRRSTPICFGTNGKGEYKYTFHIRSVEIFHIVTAFKYGFECDENARKLIIVTPIPYKIFTVRKGIVMPADTGDVVDEYKIFNATGFFGAIERDCVER